MTKLIAIPIRDGMVDDHFDHCAYYTIVTLEEQNQNITQEYMDSPERCGCKSNIVSIIQMMGITLMLAGNMVLESFHHHDRDHHEEKPVDYTAYGDVDITENAFGNVTANQSKQSKKGLLQKKRLYQQ